MSYVYHYTDGDGAIGILESGVIKASSTAYDAAFGRGVYFTEYTPDMNKLILLVNNYDDGKSLIEVNWSKTDFCFAIKKRNLRGLKKCSTGGGRNVWLYPHDVHLENFEFLFGPTTTKHELSSYQYVQF